MASELIVSGITTSTPVATLPSTIPGLVVWAYFGSTFATDNTNLAPGGAPFVNIGTGPERIAPNYCRMWYNAAIRSGWRRDVEGSDGPVTIVAVGRATLASAGVQQLIGDARLYLSPKEVETANANDPAVSSYRFSTAGPVHPITTALAWRAYALTEPASGVSGTSRIMDLTGDAETTTVQNGQTSVIGSDNYLSFGTAAGAASGSKRMDIAWAAAVAGTQMTRANILSQILAPARTILALRGITGV